jgi:hypothetical protein
MAGCACIDLPFYQRTLTIMRLLSLSASQFLVTAIKWIFFIPGAALKKTDYLHYFLLLLILASFAACRQRAPLPAGDKDNGGLQLPGGFEAVVVADSIGRARHITVNDNGDIYVKLTYNDIMHGSGGTAAIRDQDHDGKADIITYFGDYKDEGGLPAGIRIYNGYLYTTTVRNIFRNKLNSALLPAP